MFMLLFISNKWWFVWFTWNIHDFWFIVWVMLLNVFFFWFFDGGNCFFHFFFVDGPDGLFGGIFFDFFFENAIMFGQLFLFMFGWILLILWILEASGDYSLWVSFRLSDVLLGFYLVNYCNLDRKRLWGVILVFESILSHKCVIIKLFLYFIFHN